MTAGRPTVCRAMASPGKSAEFILSRYNFINTARWLSLTAPNICANGQPVWFVAVCVGADEFFASPGRWM